jgi:hypothetical protein
LKYIVLFFILFSITAYAQEDQYILDGGIGVSHSADGGLSETKMLTLGIQEDLWGALKDRAIIGGYLDDKAGRSSSALVSGQVGWEVNNNGFLIGAFTGPTLISSPDNVLLGSYFEFMEDLHLGIQDKDNNYEGFFYRHISDAGLTSVNIGRDIIGLELKF